MWTAGVVFVEFEGGNCPYYFLYSYFYERKEQLKQDIDETDSGKAQMLSNEYF